jgi:hypothetical protein
VLASILEHAMPETLEPQLSSAGASAGTIVILMTRQSKWVRAALAGRAAGCCTSDGWCFALCVEIFE